MPGECGLIGHISGQIVSQGWTLWQNRADQFRQDALEFLDDLKNNPDFQLDPIGINYNFTVEAATPIPYQAPDRPEFPELVFEVPSTPSSVNLNTVTPPSLEDAPEFTAVQPSLLLPSRPDSLAVTPPGDVPAVTDLTLPPEPELLIPDVPTLRELEIEDFPGLSLPEWLHSAPSYTPVPPGEFLNFTEGSYDSDTLDQVVDRVQQMLAGGTGMPDVIWDALWDRGRMKEDEAGLRLIQEATEEWAGRGFTLPPGALSARVAAARQLVQNSAITLAREQAIERAKMEQGNIQFAVSQGIALETVLIGQHNAEMQRALEVAKFVQEFALSIFNAKVSFFSAEIQKYQTLAQVHKILIESELTKLDVYKAKLEGQKLIGELNLQDVEVFKSRITAVATEAEVYKTKVAAVEVAAKVQLNKIEAFKAAVEAYSERVKAKSTEVQAYAEGVKGELALAQIYELESNVFAKRVEAWRSKNQGQIEAKRIELEGEEFKLKKYLGEIEAFKAIVSAESEKIRGFATVTDAKARVFTAEVQAESARLEGENQTYRTSFERSKAEAEVELKKAELNIEQVQRLLALELERIKTVNNVHAQLAAATMAAVNLSATVSEQASNSTSCSTNYSY